MLRSRSSLLVGLLVVGAFEEVNAADGPPSFALPDTVRPTRYALDLRILPEQARFCGRAGRLAQM